MKPKSQKRVQLIGTLVGIVIGFLTIIACVTGSFGKLYHYFTDGIRIVVRDQQFLPGATNDQIQVAFSLVNVAKQRVYVNDLTLRVGDYAVGGPPPTMMVILSNFSHELRVRFVKDLKTGKLMPVLSEKKSPDSMGTTLYSLLRDGRIGLEPGEQVDFKLELDLERPASMAGKYDTIWKLGGRLELNYERTDLRRGSARYPKERL